MAASLTGGSEEGGGGGRAPRILVVDLNNFARYPTVPVGYLVAVCRQAGMPTRVFSPLSIGVSGVTRERAPRPWSLPLAKAGYLTAVSPRPWVRRVRSRLAMRRLSQMKRREGEVLAAFERVIAEARPDVVLISTYLMYKDLTAAICAACAQAGIKTLVGGPYFSQPEVVAEWIGTPGLSALAAGEIELHLPEVIRALAADEDASRFPGVLVPSEQRAWRGAIAPPLKALDHVPCPDYSDFPWEKYPQRIVPVITGRGCAWGACTFCSDVTSSAGRTFRSRSPENVLEELKRHHETLGVRMFVFTDLKLNSDVRVWRAVLERMQIVAPGSTWIASIHVHEDRDNGLSFEDLRAAAASGCVRLSTGLESGSQRVLDLMHKGTRIETVARYLHDATAAGISTRCTMITGYPGEAAGDVELTTAFLREHSADLERISLNRLAVIQGTGLQRMWQRSPADFPDLQAGEKKLSLAVLDHRLASNSEPAYRAAVMRLLEAVHEVNRKPLNERARAFEGVM